MKSSIKTLWLYQNPFTLIPLNLSLVSFPFLLSSKYGVKELLPDSCQLHRTMWWCNIISFLWSICAKAETMQICHIYGIITTSPKTAVTFCLPLVLSSKSLLHLSSTVSLTSWLVVWIQRRAARNSQDQSFMPELQHKERVWQLHSLGLISDKDIECVRDTQSQDHWRRGNCQQGIILSQQCSWRKAAWFPSVVLQYFIWWQTQKLESRFKSQWLLEERSSAAVHCCFQSATLQ